MGRRAEQGLFRNQIRGKVMSKAEERLMEKQYNLGYKKAQRDIISIIQARLEEIPGDAQPRPILRAELQELMIKIMEEEK